MRVLLPEPGGSDDGELLAGGDGEGDVAQHRHVGVVPEGEVAERHLATQPRGQVGGRVRFVDGLVPVEGLEDALAARHGPEQHVELFAEHDDRVKQHGDELGEEHDPAQRHAFLDHVAAAEPEHRADGDGRHAVGERPVGRLEAHRLRLRGEVALVDLGVAPVVVVLPARKLHDLQPREVLLQVLVERRDGQPDQAEEHARGAAEVEGDDGDQGQGEQQDAGQLGADREHDDQGDEERRELADQGAETAQQFVERLDVVGHAGHHAPHRDAVVEREGPRLEVPEQVEAQVAQPLDHGRDERHAMRMHGHGPGELQHDVEAARREQRGQAEPVGEGDGEFDQAHVRRIRVGLAPDHVVDADQRDHHGEQDLQGGGDEHERPAHREGGAVGLHPVEHAAQQREVHHRAGQLGVEHRVVAPPRRHAGALGHYADAPAAAA